MYSTSLYTISCTKTQPVEGYFQEVESEEIQPCAKNTYSDQKGATQCEGCPDNTVVAESKGVSKESCLVSISMMWSSYDELCMGCSGEDTSPGCQCVARI